MVKNVKVTRGYEKGHGRTVMREVYPAASGPGLHVETTARDSICAAWVG